MIVMVALGTSLVVTLAFVRTQSTMLQIRRNALRTDLALQAAQTGAAVGLERTYASDWTGVSEMLVRDVYTDSEGTASYSVEFEPVDSASAGEDSGFRLVVASTGIWQSHQYVDERVEKTTEVEVRLLPRLDGRPIAAGDSEDADDQVAIETWFEDVQAYSLFARGLGGSLLSLDLDPRDRFDGDVWIRNVLDLYNGPTWNAATRQEFIKSVGQVHDNGAPHPFNGDLTFYTAPDTQLETDLDDIEAGWSVTTDLPSYPNNVKLSDWTPYYVYDGGFQYNAVEVAASLQDVTLGPTPDNPLGIFYSNTTMTLYDNVTIQGTLVCLGRVDISGDSVHLASVNWRDATGTSYVDNVDLWPRLPTVVATRLKIDIDTRVSIDGAVFAHTEFTAGGGEFGYSSATDVDLTGTATSQLAAQPFSVVALQDTPDLSPLNENGDHAVWLEDGTSGTWHPIVGVDTLNHELTVVGEVAHVSPTNYRIRRSRTEYVDIRGPLITKRANLRRPAAWGLTATQWDERYATWQAENEIEAIEFADWLADPGNFSGWGAPYEEFGLSIEPTFHVKHEGGTEFQWKPQLFEKYDGTGPDAEFAGYRWEVISWRDAI